MSHDEPLVSVVIPTYNRRDYLQQAIMSVLAQSYSNNAGRSVARNRGMDAARGICLAFLDDDDLCLPET